MMKKMFSILMAALSLHCFGLDLRNLPDVSTLDPDWAKDALPVAEWGWSELKKDTPITQIPFRAEKPRSYPSLALPYDGQFADFALKKPELLGRIVIDADQLNTKHQIAGDELDRIMVYVSPDGKSYTPVKPEISTQFYTAEDHTKRKVVWVRVTLKGNFYGRYFRIYAPWGKSGYVYRFFNGPQRVRVFAKLQELPDVSTLDPDWAKDALPVAEWGWSELKKDTPITQIPFRADTPGSYPSLALPYDGQFADFALKEPELLARIVIDADQLNTKHQIAGDELDRIMVYVSPDGKSYTPVKPEISTQFYTAMDHTKRKVVWVRISLKGNFYGRYFRIYAPWGKSGYVYRFFNGPKRVKVFAKLEVKNFSVPLSTDGKFDCAFEIAGADGVEGKAVFRIKDGPVLAERPLADFAGGASVTMSADRKDLPAGIHTAQLDIVRRDGVVLASRSQKFACYPDKLILNHAGSASWRVTNIRLGSRKVPFLCASAPGDQIEFTVPRDGVFALYAVIRGKGTFRFSVAGQVRPKVALDLWNPQYDRTPWTVGENFIGIYSLKNGDQITVAAENAGAQLGEVFLLPASGEQQKIYHAKTPEGQYRSIIDHGDGFSDFFYRELTLPMMQNRIASLKAANVIAYDWCIGTSAVNYPSKVATMFGKQRNIKFSRKRDQQAAERMEKLNQTTGKDSLQIFREETQKQHMLYSITLRPNAFYGKDDVDKNAQYLLDHPEFYMVDPIGKSVKPSYAYPEVRNFYLELAKEIAAYKPDILTIEFLRHPPYFGYDKPLVERYRRLYGSCGPDNYQDERWLKMIGQIMTEWLQELHREVRKIHPDIQLLISFDCENYRKHGVDIAAILKLGLADAISPGFYGNGPQKYFPLKPFRDMIGQSPKKVKIYPRVETTIEGHDPTPEEEAGLVVRPRQLYCSDNQWKSIFYRFVQDGADGIRPFNTGGAGMARMLNDRAEIERFVTFTEPLLDIRRIGWEEK